MESLNSTLTDNVGPSATTIIYALAVLAIVIFAIIVMMGILKAASGRSFGSKKSKEARLSVVDKAAIDRTRRLVLIKRDGVEHLILIGGPTDVVIEKNIGAAHAAKAARAERLEKAEKDNDILKLHEGAVDENHKDADLTASFDNLLDDSELIYKDAPINDHLQLGDEIVEDVEPEIVAKDVKAEKKPDIIKSLLGRHRSKLKKSPDKAKETIAIDKEPKQTKQNPKIAEKADAVKVEIKRESEEKAVESAKDSYPMLDHEEIEQDIQDAKASKASLTKAQIQELEQEQLMAQSQEEPATAQQAARERIVHEIEGVVEKRPASREATKPARRVEHTTKIEPKIVADVRAEARTSRMENKARIEQGENQAHIAQAEEKQPHVPLQAKRQTEAKLEAEAVDEQVLEKQAEQVLERHQVLDIQKEQRPTAKAEAKSLQADESIARLYRETEPRKAAIYHAPVEKMPMVEPVEAPKEYNPNSGRQPTSQASAQMQQATNHAPMATAVINQATALKIEDEEDYQYDSDEIAEARLEEELDDDFVDDIPQNNIHAARRVPANKEVAKPENIKSENAQTETILKQQNAAKMMREDEDYRQEQIEERVPAHRMQDRHFSHDDMRVTAPIYEMENFAEVTIQPSKTLELKNDHILTQNSFYYSPVDDAHALDVPDEYSEPVPQRRIIAKQEATRKNGVNESAEFEGRVEPRFAKEIAMEQKIEEAKEIGLDTMEEFEEDFDSMFEDELRQVVKSDK